MSIAQFGPAERSVADTLPRPRSGRTPSSRLAVAQGERAATPEPR